MIYSNGEKKSYFQKELNTSLEEFVLPLNMATAEPAASSSWR